MRRAGSNGFTLIEIMVAVAILGASVFIIMEVVYSVADLHLTTRDAVTAQSLLNQALARAEIELQAGNISGDGDFGDRYEDWSYRFEGTRVYDDVGLYEITVTVTPPDEGDPMAMTFHTYYMRE
jgi:prepilin-type N-terminal cleavage/methylation domain-containing protein